MKNMQINQLNTVIRKISLFAALFGMIHLGSTVSFAAFGEDVEKPKPEFTRDGAVVTAKLLPRGKSTKVTIGFEAKSGDVDVQALDFSSVNTSQIETKNFRSDLFTITVSNVPVGGEIPLTVRSNYFSSSTRFFLFNEHATPQWNDAQAQLKTYPDKVRDLTLTVKDGGPYDADGAADGKIVLNGGPSDSFWGYAIGTLFIRFFGVFLVLGVLQIGMILCGRIFESADKRKAEREALSFAQVKASMPPQPSASAEVVVAEPEMEPEMVAAISLALHLEMSGGADSGKAMDGDQSAWNLYGRQKIMSDRLQVFHRHSH